MEKLTAVIIAKNEEDKIALCLDSIKWVDEIVVVDDMSSDRTAEICLSYGAKVIKHSSEGNFDRQRNVGIDNASGKWILQLDADEIVTGELRNEIEKVLQNPMDNVAYRFLRKNYFLGHFMQYGGYYGAYSNKLTRKDSARHIGRSVHETLKIEGNIGTINGNTEHYAVQTISQYIKRQNLYTSVEANVLLDEGKIPNAKEMKYNLRIRPVKLFWKNYIRKKGYKDGMYGLIYSILSAWRYFLIYAKLWEILNQKERENK